LESVSEEITDHCGCVDTSFATKKILELEKQAAQTELPPLHSLTSYWKLDVRHCPEKSEEIVKRFSALD